MAADRSIEWCRVAAYVRCFDEHGRVVLARIGEDGNPWDGGWTMPGGGMEWDEQPTDTAIREFRVPLGSRNPAITDVAGHNWWERGC